MKSDIKDKRTITSIKTKFKWKHLLF